MKNLLSAEQSATLIAKGISADKASKRIVRQATDYKGNPFPRQKRWKDCEPYDKSLTMPHVGLTRFEYKDIFTLADILSLLPKEIDIDAHRCGLNMWYHNAHYWMVSYIQFDGAEIVYQSPVVSRDSLIDALYEFLCLCIRNGYINLTK